MGHQALREQAIHRYERGESPRSIYRSLKKSKTWFYKWLQRFHQDGAAWSQDHSRRPQHTPKKLNSTMEQTIIDLRTRLQQIPYAFIGALTIHWQLQQQGLEIPIATINKVLKRNQLVRQPHSYQATKIAYPAVLVTASNVLHEFEVVGPRYLKTDGRFYAANIIDAYDRRCSINPIRHQTKDEMLYSLIRSWQNLGIPDYLQMDNKVTLHGSNRYPHSFGLVVRLCLYLGIQPLFIPLHEPWRNGIIEKFQDLFDKQFFRTQAFADFTQLQEQATAFEQFHNQEHRYSPLGGKTPQEKRSGNLRYLPRSFTLPEQLAITPGYIHAIRFIRSDRRLNLFGETIILPKTLIYEYIWITIDTQQQTLTLYHEQQLIQTFKYPLPHTTMEVAQIDL